MRKIALVLFALLAAPIDARSRLHVYTVIHTNESRLVLDGDYGIAVASAQTFCWEHDGFTAGAVIYSTEMLEACATAILISTRGRTCKVWCP